MRCASVCGKRAEPPDPHGTPPVNRRTDLKRSSIDGGSRNDRGIDMPIADGLYWPIRGGTGPPDTPARVYLEADKPMPCIRGLIASHGSSGAREMRSALVVG